MSLLLAAVAFLALPPSFPVSNVTHGQKGECHTVFEGNTIEPFPFEVKGVMKNFLGPGKDLVLTRLLGDKANFTGVVAGMSGSPCYIDGKLLGALAYSFAIFAKEPIAGITPIDSMLDVMRLPEEARPWRVAGGTDADWQAIAHGTPLAHADAAPGGARPIATPLMLGGVPPGVQEHFAPWFRSVGFEPVAGGSSSSGATGKGPGRFEPGGAISAVLVRGDMDVAATGTVTWVDGNTVLGFGHPFFGAGAVSIPMASADILNTMASTMRSFKMSTTGDILGEITQDRLTAIGGFMGGQPKMIPVRGSIKTPKGKSTFNMEVARDLVMTPRMVAMAISSGLAGRVDSTERGTVRLNGEIKVQGQPPVPVHNVYAAQRDGSLLMNAAVDVAKNFAALWDTPFGLPPTVEISVDAVVEPEPIEEWVESVSVDRAQVHPGGTVQVAVNLRRQGGALNTERFSVPVPRAWAGQEVDLAAAGVEAAEHLARDVGGVPHPTEYAQIGRYLANRRADGQVYLLAVREGTGLHAAVDDWAFVPPSVVATLSGDPSKQSRRHGIAWEERRQRPGTVTGAMRASVQVLPY